MRMPPGAEALREGRDGQEGRERDELMSMKHALLAILGFGIVATPVAIGAVAAVLPAVQVTFEATIDELSSDDPQVRLRALRLLNEARYPEAAEPLAALLTDPDDDIQLEAIAVELNLFLAQPMAFSRRVGLVIERRGPTSAEDVFAEGPLAFGPHAVPSAVFAGLRAAMTDDNRRIALEATYAAGALGGVGGGFEAEWRRDLGADLVVALGHDDARRRLAALRAIGRVFGQVSGRVTAVAVGDAVVGALADRQRDVRIAALETLGRLRYDRGLQPIMEIFSREGGALNDAAFAALALIGHASAGPIFIDQLTAGNVERRRVAVEGLARTGLPGMLIDLESRLRRETDRALALAGAFAELRLGRGFLEPILSSLVQPRQAQQAFGYLVESVSGRSATLAAYARDPDAEIRARVADAIALAGDADARGVAESLTRDPAPEVVAAAVRAVSWLDQRR